MKKFRRIWLLSAHDPEFQAPRRNGSRRRCFRVVRQGAGLGPVPVWDQFRSETSSGLRPVPVTESRDASRVWSGAMFLGGAVRARKANNVHKQKWESKCEFREGGGEGGQHPPGYTDPPCMTRDGSCTWLSTWIDVTTQSRCTLVVATK